MFFSIYRMVLNGLTWSLLKVCSIIFRKVYCMNALKYYYINNYTKKNHENKHLLNVWEFLYAFQNCKLRTFSGNDGLISWTNFSTTHSVNTIGIAVAEKKFSISSIPTTEDIFFFSTSNSFLFNFVETNVFFFSRNIRWYLLASLPNNEW